MAFTLINSYSSIQSLSLATEICVAYNKRRLVCGLSTFSLSEGVDVWDFFHTLQAGIEEMIPYFADNTPALAGQTALPSNYASVSAGMTDLGLTATGYWRRIPDTGQSSLGWWNYGDASYSYGRCEDGDLMGPWLWLDLQNTLKNLTRQIKSVTPDYLWTDTYTNNEDTVWEEVPTWEGVGSPDTTIDELEAGSASLYINKARNKSYMDGTYDQIQASLRNYRYSCPYTPVTGTGGCAAYVVSIVNPTTDYVFPSITGLTSEDIGKTVTTAATRTTDTAYGWVIKRPDYWTKTWADISSELAWSDCTEPDEWYGKYLGYSSHCMALNYSFSDGSTT